MGFKLLVVASSLTLFLCACADNAETSKEKRETIDKEVVSSTWLEGKTLQDVGLPNGVFSLVGSQMLGKYFNTIDKQLTPSKGNIFVSVQVGVSIVGKEKNNSITFLDPKFKVYNDKTNEEYDVLSVGTLNSDFGKQNDVITSSVTYLVIVEVPKDLALSGFNLTIYDSKDIGQMAEKPLFVKVQPEDSHIESGKNEVAPDDKPLDNKTLDNE